MDERYPQGFRPLFAPAPPNEPVVVPEPLPQAECEPVQAPPAQEEPRCACERGALHDVALFRATLREMLESRTHELLAKLAEDILARELVLAPPDIRALVTRALADCDAREVLEIRLAPHDAARFPLSDVAIRVDAGLVAGEMVIETRSGTFESRLPVRVAHMLEAIAP